MAQYTQYVNQAEGATSNLASTLKSTSTPASTLSSALKATAASMGVMLAVDLAIQAAANAVSNWIHRVEIANGEMRDAVSEYDSAKSSLESITSELEEHNIKIHELQAKGTLTYAEKGQLEELKSITKELLVQQEIEKKRMEQASKEAAEKTITAYEKQYGGYDLSEDDLKGKLAHTEVTGVSTIPISENDITGIIASSLQTQELLEEAKRNFEEALKTGSDTTWFSQNIQYYTDMADRLSDMLDASLADLLEKQLALENEYQNASGKLQSAPNSLTSAERDILRTYESIEANIQMIQKYTDSSGLSQMEKDISPFLLSFRKKFENLWDSSTFSDIRSELARLAEESGITADNIHSLASENRDLAELLEQSGMSAQFAAACFNKVCEGADGFSAVTEDTLALDRALHSMDQCLMDTAASHSAYEESLMAPDYNDEFQNYQEAYQNALEMFDNGEYGRHFRSTMEYLLGDDSYTMSIEEMKNAVQSLESVFGDSSEHGLGFLDKLYEHREILDGLGSSLEKLSDGSFDFDLNPEEFDTIAQALGMTTEEVSACVSALGMFGDYSSYNLDQLEETLLGIAVSSQGTGEALLSLQGVQNMLTDLGYSGYEAYNILNDIQNMDSVKLLDFSASDAGSIDQIVETLKALDMLEINGDNVNVESLATSLADTFHMTADDISGFLENLGDSFHLADAAGNLLSQEEVATLVQKSVDSSVAKDLETIRAVSENTTAQILTLSDAILTLNNSSLSAITGKFSSLSGIIASITNSLNTNTSPQNASGKNGNKNGPKGVAYATGSPGIPRDETALINELGNETIIDPKKGTYEIVAGGAQFRKLKKGQIILNHLQTRALQTRGKIASFGQTVFHGSIPWKGNSYARGTVPGNHSTGSYSSGSGQTSGSGYTSGSAAQSPDRDTTKTYNWIEKALTRLKEAYDRLNKAASSVYRAFSKRNTALAQEVDALHQQIDAQQKAYEAYIQKAGSVGLSDHYKELVHNGSIQIEDITDETLQKQIQEYQEYYEAAIKAADAVTELRESLGSLAREKFDLISSEFDSQLSLIEKEASLIDVHISNTKAQGHLVSARYYEFLYQTEKRTMEQLTADRAALKASLQEAIDTGAIEPGSKAFRDMQAEILGVEKALLESGGALTEFSNNLRKLTWERFDLLQDTISQITDEADWLINRFQEDTLFDDNGNLSQEGLAAAGLYGVKYNTYLNQAIQYGQELLTLEEALAKDPYNTDLMERRYQLVEAQRKVIDAAADEKDAMRDLVKDGIDLQLKSLQSLIDKRKDALRAEKDLYSYQKQVTAQTETISGLEKQMEAYKGDTSEETRARLQQLKVKLEDARENLKETEYDRYLSDQEALMDEIYTQYEEIMNQRLDNLDALVENLIDQVNSSASMIGETISGKADSLGVQLSDAMERIWNGDGSIRAVLSASVNNLSGFLTTTGAAINDIKKLLEDMQKASDREAMANTAAAAGAATAPTVQTPAAKTETAPASPASPKSSGSSWGSWFRSKRDSYPKHKLNTETSIVDRLKYRDIDSSFSARRDYFYAMGGSGTYTGSAQQNLWMIAQMRANGYRQGARSIPYNQLAWTNEGGQELLYRKADGALLTRLGTGDKVFTHGMTENLWKLSNSRIADQLTKLPAFPEIPGAASTVTNHFSLENVTLPNVTNYEEFKRDLIRDRQFNAAIKDSTLGEALGYNSLKKYSRK